MMTLTKTQAVKMLVSAMVIDVRVVSHKGSTVTYKPLERDVAVVSALIDREVDIDKDLTFTFRDTPHYKVASHVIDQVRTDVVVKATH